MPPQRNSLHSYKIDFCSSREAHISYYQQKANYQGTPVGTFTYQSGACMSNLLSENGGGFIYMGCGSVQPQLPFI